MNIINKAALQGLKKNRTQTAVTVIGVILAASMFAAVITFGISLLDYMIRGAGQTYGGWHVAFMDVAPSFVQERVSDEETAGAATFENIGYAMLEGGENPNKPYLFIAGFDQEAFDALPVTLISGRLPENSSEVLLSGRIQTETGVSYEPGDTLSLLVGKRINAGEQLGQCDPYTDAEVLEPGEEKTYQVVGICGTPAFEEDSSPGYTVITWSDGADAADDLSVFLTLENPYQVHSYVKAVSDGHACMLNRNVLRFMGLSHSPGDRIFTAFLYSVGGVVVAIIMIGSVFLIYNAFSISLNERIQQIGILASVGATAKQLRGSVLFEGLCIGMIGTPLGILAGLAGVNALISMVSGKFGSILYAGTPLTMKVTPLAIAGAAAVSVLTILISAYIPAKKAAGMPVMECIRQTNEVKLEGRTVRTSRRMHRLFGLEGVLALKNFKRNRKRYRSIILSLVLSIVLFISTSSLVQNLQKVADPKTEVSDCDIAFGTQAMGDSEMMELYDKLQHAAGVYESYYQAYMEGTGIVRADTLSNAYWKTAGSASSKTVELALKIRFFEDNIYEKILEILNLPLEEYTGQNAKPIAVAQIQDNSERREGDPLNDMFRDSSLDLIMTPKGGDGFEAGQEQKVTVTFAEFVPPDAPPSKGSTEEEPYIFWVMYPWSMKEAFVPADTPADRQMLKGMSFQSENPSQSISEMRTVIQNEEDMPSYILLNLSKMLEENRNMVFIVNVFAYSFIVIISLIAVTNVFNTISTNVRLRRRELAMLRSVGMSDKDFNKMMRFECAFYGVKALLYGLPLAVAVSWLIYKGSMDGEMVFVLPWRSIGISVVSVLLVIFITMMYAVSKIKKENIIDALRDDMT